MINVVYLAKLMWCKFLLQVVTARYLNILFWEIFQKVFFRQLRWRKVVGLTSICPLVGTGIDSGPVHSVLSPEV